MPSRVRVLVVDDPESRSSLVANLADRGYEVSADGADAGLDGAPHVMVVGLPESALRAGALVRSLRTNPDPPPIVAIGSGTLDSVLAAFRNGAVEYLIRPVRVEELLVSLERLGAARRVAQESRERAPAHGELLGSSGAMLGLAESIDQAAATRATVLVLGESGTGKELVASEIHGRGPRAGGPLVKVHCAALTESLLESELFGHERGSFTGALTRHVGRFERANHGTLFLDEIGEIPPSVQIKLLRVLQEHAFERVGGNESVHVDVRVIAATNRDLARSVATGAFRGDLYYRLNVLPIHTPALREHPDDIPLLAVRFLAQHPLAGAKAICGITGEALAALVRHRWPGNVRELENAIEYAVVMSPEGSAIPISALPPSIVGDARCLRSERPLVPGATLAEIERHAILTTLEACGGCTSRAARILRISTRKIQYRLQAYRGAPRSGVEAIALPGRAGDHGRPCHA